MRPVQNQYTSIMRSISQYQYTFDNEINVAKSIYIDNDINVTKSIHIDKRSISQINRLIMTSMS